MMETEGRKWIGKLQKRWIVFSFVRVVLLALSIALLFASLSFYFFHIWLLVFILTFAASFAGFSSYARYWVISTTDISRFIDLHYPEAEESSSLLLQPIDQLSFLEQLQVQHVNDALISLNQPSAPLKQLKFPLLLLLGAIAFTIVFHQLPAGYFAPVKMATVSSPLPKVVENIPVQISSFNVKITPPSYTGKPARSQQQFTVTAENGAKVNWQIQTTRDVKALSFIFNDSQLIKLHQSDADGTLWSLSQQLFKPGFYQVVIEGKKSDFYQIEIIPDRPVSIKITKPLQHSTIDIGQPQQVNLSVQMQDDYGIADAYISATMASGKGEAVSFKEKKITFSASFSSQTQMKINKLLPLSEMGMKPGDELYFYIQAKDNFGQVSRSDMYFVSIQDTTELMSLTGIDNGVNLVPEYFRSERQIIIDTEKLIKDKAVISDTEFKKRSNDLGIDQKMLRLRYGKFLGEESEASIGGEHEDDHDHEPAGNHKEEAPAKENLESIMGQYAHVHDNAEDATFFEPQLKAQLKATLTEMWNAELRLRTYRPAEALPYEYKALRLLKDLQQKSRAYVAKTTFKTSTLKPEKRLTGELTAVKGGAHQSNFETAENYKSVLKRAIGLLENIKDNYIRTPKDLSLLMQAQRSLVDGASIAPGKYLPALKAMKKIIGAGQSGALSRADLNLAQQGVNSLIGKQAASPNPQTNSSPSALTRSYFNQLKRLMP